MDHAWRSIAMRLDLSEAARCTNAGCASVFSSKAFGYYKIPSGAAFSIFVDGFPARLECERGRVRELPRSLADAERSS